MTERTTLEIIAPTVEQALAQGLAELGLPATAVSVEVLDSGNTGLFGLGGRQVRVRLTVNPPPGAATNPAATTHREAPMPAEKRPAPTKAGEHERAQRPPRPERRAAQKPAAAAPSELQAARPRAIEIPADGHDPLLDRAEAIVSKLLFLMGLEAQVSAHYGEPRDERRPIMVDVRGSDLGILIGRRGETLDAFQYVAALIVGKESGQFIHLVVDVEGHRDRREQQLRQLARRMAEQVIKTGRRLTLEPMRPAERRIIHMELRDHPAVTTESMGEEPHRKITILPKE